MAAQLAGSITAAADPVTNGATQPGDSPADASQLPVNRDVRSVVRSVVGGVPQLDNLVAALNAVVFFFSRFALRFAA